MREHQHTRFCRIELARCRWAATLCKHPSDGERVKRVLRLSLALYKYRTCFLCKLSLLGRLKCVFMVTRIQPHAAMKANLFSCVRSSSFMPLTPPPMPLSFHSIDDCDPAKEKKRTKIICFSRRLASSCLQNATQHVFAWNWCLSRSLALCLAIRFEVGRKKRQRHVFSCAF
jgi:hypothetical protein